MRYVQVQQIQCPNAIHGVSVGTYRGSLLIGEAGGFTIVKVDVSGIAPAILHLTDAERRALVRALSRGDEW